LLYLPWKLDPDIHSLLKEIGKGERIALSKLVVEFLERNRRPIRIAIDIAIWQFQNQAGQGGQNPALRTFYYRLLRILALPIHPLFVYDGPKKPLAKRNKVVSRYGTTSLHNEMSKKLLQLFRFPYRTAPGEAEAECALLQREGIVDAVMSQDVDAVMWGSTMTLRDWSQEGTRGNKTATHVNVLRADETKEKTRLDPDGMILIAILSGGDYAPDGIPGFGPGLACEIAKAGFGKELLEVMRKGDGAGLADWRERLQYEIETNESGWFRTKHKSLKLPENFPDATILGYYTHPAVSNRIELQRLRTELKSAWDGDIDTPELREYVAQTFNWQYRGGACKFIRSLAPALLAQRLLRRQNNTTISSQEAILERRMHFVNDGMPELRLSAVPADIVGLNTEDEEDNPEYVKAMEEAAAAAAADEDAEEGEGVADAEDEQPEPTANTSRPRKKASWDPRNPEKMWLSETIVKLGLPNLVEEWEQTQRDLLTDQKKTLANKARKTATMTATQQTRSLHAYFMASKPTTTGLSASPVSPKKPRADEERSSRASSTPTRRKTKPATTQPRPIPDTSTNPFSIANQQIRAQTTSTTNPKQRSRQEPLQKSKTLPSSFAEPIIISSSPPPAATAATCRPSTPPPTSHASSAALSVNEEDSSCSLPSPSQLFQSPKRPNTHRKKATPPTAERLPPNAIPLTEIFGPFSRSNTASTNHRTTPRPKEKKNVVPRDSLPGTWREVLDSECNERQEMRGCRKQKAIPRVSLVDLTDD
jgi:holliday junction resolvase YEN1